MSNRTVYQYNSAGMYVAATLADESPLEPGVFLIPANATEIAIPESWPEDQWPRFNGANWQLVTKPKLADADSPEQKLAEFLQNNPDVVALIR
ncbi:phage tail protein [Acinetobacter ursingii]|uniref:phage tail protein n=1 Tax=Acinetobacter ursingii TaxID=108980 RepID=UPI00300A6F75